MKIKPPFDATFERIPEPLLKWQYVDRDVNLAYMAWGLQHQFSLATLDDYLQEDGWDVSSAAQENRAMMIERRAQALQAFKSGNRELAFAWINFLFAAMRAGKRENFLLPLSRTGKKFVSGRKVGAVGPVRAAVRGLMKRSPNAKPAKLWESLKAKSPKGLSFVETPRDKYIEIDLKTLKQKIPEGSDRYKYVSYRRFLNIVSEERGLLTSQQS